MTEPARPDEYWRRIVRQGFFQHRTAPLLQGVDDPRLRVDAEAEYKNAHQLLRQFRAQGATPKAMEPARLSLFVASVALLTYGQLHVIPDILDNLPPVRHPARLLARSVSALLPLPADADVFTRPALVLAWVEANRPAIVWSETLGRFCLQPASGHPPGA